MWTPLATGLGASAGFGASDLLGGVFSALDAPRRATWQALGMGETGEDLMGNLGLDTDNPWVQALGMGSEMLLDPLNLIGAGVGGKLGRVAGTILDRFPALQRTLQARNAALGTVARDAGYADLARAIPDHSQVGYAPEVLAQLPDLGGLGAGPRTFGRPTREAGQALNELGIGNMGPQGLTVLGNTPPPVAETASNWLRIRPEHQGLQNLRYTDTLVGPGAAAPPLPAGMIRNADDLVSAAPESATLMQNLRPALADTEFGPLSGAAARPLALQRMGQNNALLESLQTAPLGQLAREYVGGGLRDVGAELQSLRSLAASAPSDPQLSLALQGLRQHGPGFLQRLAAGLRPSALLSETATGFPVDTLAKLRTW